MTARLQAGYVSVATKQISNERRDSVNHGFQLFHVQRTCFGVDLRLSKDGARKARFTGPPLVVTTADVVTTLVLRAIFIFIGRTSMYIRF